MIVHNSKNNIVKLPLLHGIGRKQLLAIYAYRKAQVSKANYLNMFMLCSYCVWLVARLRISSIDGLCNKLYAHKEYANKEL